MSECQHDWMAGSPLRLIVAGPMDVFAAFTMAPPQTLPVEYCRHCGVIRVPPDRVPRAQEG